MTDKLKHTMAICIFTFIALLALPLSLVAAESEKTGNQRQGEGGGGNRFGGCRRDEVLWNSAAQGEADHDDSGDGYQLSGCKSRLENASVFDPEIVDRR